MLKKLRKQFIGIAMLSVAAVLIIIIGSINIANYAEVNRSLDAKLQLIADNGGEFPDLIGLSLWDSPVSDAVGQLADGTDSTEITQPQADGRGSGEEIADGAPVPPEKPDGQPDDTGNAAGTDSGSLPEDDPGNPLANGSGSERRSLDRLGISEETQYNTRYFTVTVADGSVSATDTRQIAAISDTEAREYALTLYEKGTTSGKGFLNGYKYLVTEVTDEDGNVSLMYIFLDSRMEIRTARNFLLVSVSVSMAGLLVVLLLVIYFSGRIVKPMAESYEKQKRFITDASHEIKTPLTIIDANTEVLEMMEGENEWTEGIRKQIKRLTSLTNKLVFLSRMDEESTKLEMIDFPISDVILDVAEGFTAVAETRGKTLTMNVQQGLTYTGDEKNIRQLVSLLMDNAMKYSSDHGEIRLTFQKNSRNLVLTVWNTVDEIAKGSQDILFDRFYRADSSHNSKTGGFGIGLSVAQAIVVAHKGRISAKSEDGKSIIFTVIL